jgi:hypothetical protein
MRLSFRAKRGILTVPVGRGRIPRFARSDIVARRDPHLMEDGGTIPNVCDHRPPLLGHDRSFWSFMDGIPMHLVEYMDTALMARQSTPKESDAPSPVHA